MARNILGCLVLSFFITSTQIYSKQCTTDQLEQMKPVEVDAIKMTKKLKTEIQEALQTKIHNQKKIPPRELEKLSRAKGVIDCAESYIGKIPYSCIETRRNVVAQAYWIFAKRIFLTQYFWNMSSKQMAAILLHELSHKCGTTDAMYFIQSGTTPKDTMFIFWYAIASTYDYWALNGFCMPGDCDGSSSVY